MVGRPPAVWFPDQATIEASHLDRVMRTLGIDTYRELHVWSTSDVDAFWRFVIEDVGVEFDVAPEAIRGSDDPRHPGWLPGARYNIVASCLRAADDDPAIVQGDGSSIREVTVGELRSMVAAFAAGFSAAGHRPGDRVAIVMPMTVEAVVAYLGTIAAGGVVVSIADSFATDEISVRLRMTEPVAIVTRARANRLGRILPMYEKVVAAGEIPCIVAGDLDDISLRPDDTTWDDFLVDGAAFAPVSQAAGAYTNVLFSSGTTGEPKAIPWTQTTPLKAAMDGRFHHDIHAGDVVAWPTNLGWMMGPWLVYAALLNGATVALFDDAPTSRGFIRFVEDVRVTMLGLVPSIVTAWRGSGVLRPGDWTSIRVLSSTGEASNPDDSAWLMEAAGGVPVIEYCGGTEIGGGYITGTVLHPAVPSRFTTPALGIGLHLVDDDGREADVGEVFLVPPSIGMSTELLGRDHDAIYYRDLPAGFGPLRRHGDQMVREPEGTFRALGRSDDTMNLGGIKVSSAEIEEVVSGAVGVVDVAAVAVPPHGGGPDRLVVFVVRGDDAPDADTMAAAMQERIRSHLNPLFRIHQVVPVDELPRTASHKVMRRVLRSEYLA
jgi:acetyl-CoA synthetase